MDHAGSTPSPRLVSRRPDSDPAALDRRPACRFGGGRACVGQTPADENPLGLPAPRDPKRPGAVLLHGGGNDGLADEIRQEFVRLAGGRDARILLMPSDMCQRGKDADGNPLPGDETLGNKKGTSLIIAKRARWR